MRSTERFARLPLAVLARADLTPAAKLVFAAISNRVGANGSAWPGQRRIAADCGLSTKAANRAVRELEVAGLLEVTRPPSLNGPRADRTCRYAIRTPSDNVHVSTTCTNRQRERVLFDHANVVDSNTQLDQVKRPTELDLEERAACAAAAGGEAERERDAGEKQTRKPGRQKPALPAELASSPDFAAAWADWLRHRSELRKPLGPTAAAAQLRKLAAWGADRATAAVRHSLANGWLGVFEEAPGRNGAMARRPTLPETVRVQFYKPPAAPSPAAVRVCAAGEPGA